MAEEKRWHDEKWFHDLSNEKKHRPALPVDLPEPPHRKWAESGYVPDPGLVDAIRVALILRKPLLLTGDPGTGKTECARFLAWKLGYKEPLVFEAKSNSEARDLFYVYDTLGRFQARDPDAKEAVDPLDFIHYNALGEAILQGYAKDAAEIQDCLPKDWKHYGPAQSVVLIDEIDKAPRDFPNDLLNEIDKSYFKIRELKNRKIEAPKGKEPQLVITSNSEKNLPAAFLRRCVYYHVPFPKDRLKEIVASRIKEFQENRASPLLRDAIHFLRYLREGEVLQKAPATAELLDWLAYLLERGADPKKSLRESQGELVKASLSTLLKHEQDQKRREDLWDGAKAWKPTD